jgi:hypothetical protein
MREAIHCTERTVRLHLPSGQTICYICRTRRASRGSIDDCEPLPHSTGQFARPLTVSRVTPHRLRDVATVAARQRLPKASPRTLAIIYALDTKGTCWSWLRLRVCDRPPWRESWREYGRGGGRRRPKCAVTDCLRRTNSVDRGGNAMSTPAAGLSSLERSTDGRPDSAQGATWTKPMTGRSRTFGNCFDTCYPISRQPHCRSSGSMDEVDPASPAWPSTLRRATTTSR